MVEACCIQCFADSLNITVHHVGRSNHVSTGLSVGNSNLSQQRQSFIVVDGAAVLQHAAMTMLGVFAQADVGNDNQFRIFCFNQLAGLLYRLVHIPAAAADSILVGRYAEEQDSGNTQFNNLVNTFHNAVDGPVVVAGQRFDFMFNVFAGNDEKRID